MKRLSLLLILISLSGCINAFSSYEEPEYSVIKSEDSITIRRYEPFIIAQVSLESSNRKQALGQGFRILADYIFGNNQQDQKIAMTAPVSQQKTDGKLIHTANLNVEQTDNNQIWNVSFTMPEKYSLSSLPKPNNSQIKIITKKGYDAAVIKFSGRSTLANFRKHQKILEEYISNQNLKTTPNPIYAYYNPPWTLWFLKRNEVIYKIKKAN